MKDAQCARCGFLAIRDDHTDAPCEATHEAQHARMHKSSQGNLTPAKFFCFADKPAPPAQSTRWLCAKRSISDSDYKNRLRFILRF